MTIAQCIIAVAAMLLLGVGAALSSVILKRLGCEG